MRIAPTMADQRSPHNLRARAALTLARLAHALVRLTIAAILFAIPAAIAVLLWRWLAG